ncbi:MAG: type VII secretion target [Sciscionella sp.]
MGTPGGEGTDVDLGALGGHAQQVRGFVEEIGQASSAGEQAGALGDNAFGIAIGQVFAAPIQIWVSRAQGFLHQTQTTGERIAEELKGSHQTYRNNEQACTSLFTNLDSGV